MKISFFIGSMGRGGAERVISILANDYCARGWDVDIVLMLKNAVEYQLDERIGIVDLTGPSTSYMKNALHWVKGIRKYLKVRKPDRVVSFAGRINALVLTATVGMKQTVIVSERNDPKHDGRGKGILWYCNRIYHRADKIVYQNAYEKSCFAKNLEKRSYIIPNPIAVNALKEDTGSLTIATAGRLGPQKNQAMLVRAMALVHKKHPKIQCRIYGGGTLQETLQQQIKESALEGTVTLEGNVSDIHERLAQCGIFVMTSNFEGLSNALIEAMMMGMPCVTTNFPGVDELITHEENGLMVPLDDHVALAEQLERLIENRELTTKLAKNAQEYAQQFKADVVLQQWRDVIGE